MNLYKAKFTIYIIREVLESGKRFKIVDKKSTRCL